jgi:hypothetical protein
MNNPQTLNRNFEAIAWGALFIWWGITELVNFLPDGSGRQASVILPPNAARHLNGIPTSSLPRPVSWRLFGGWSRWVGLEPAI